MPQSHTLFIGSNLIRLETAVSTNSLAAEAIAEKKLPEGTVIVAEEQTQGRGYAGNTWQSERGKNLLMSMVLYPNFLSPRQHFFLNQVVSLAISDTLDEHIPANEVRIKWPNDVFIGNRKVAGILIENSIKGNMIQHCIVGMGINVNQTGFGDGLKQATSLAKELKSEIPLEQLMQQLFTHFEKRYLQLKREKFEMLVKEYMKKMYLVDELATFSAQQKKFRGKIEGLTADGRLVIEQDGIHKVYGFKEVEFVLE